MGMSQQAIEVRDDWVDLYWLPLNRGGHRVRWDGRIDETVTAPRQLR
jgi:hypothetical protein